MSVEIIYHVCIFIHAIMMDMSSLFQFKLNNYCKNYSHSDKSTFLVFIMFEAFTCYFLSHQSYRQRKRIRPEQLLVYANNLDDIITECVYTACELSRDIYLWNKTLMESVIFFFFGKQNYQQKKKFIQKIKKFLFWFSQIPWGSVPVSFHHLDLHIFCTFK